MRLGAFIVVRLRPEESNLLREVQLFCNASPTQAMRIVLNSFAEGIIAGWPRKKGARRDMGLLLRSRQLRRARRGRNPAR